jgi:exonuclease SbcC
MIKYNYLIKRNEQDEIRSYVPALPQELEDLCLIEGPNASGKSTLLHIIALALYGKNNPNVCKPLKQKMYRLLESENQELTFDVVLENTQTGVSIHAAKSSPESDKIDLWETEDGKEHRLSAEGFNTKYNLIYDIPNDPTARLKDLTHDLLEQHHLVGGKLNNLRLSSRDLLTEIQNARDPDRLKKVEELIANSNSELNQLKKGIEVDAAFQKKFEQYAYSKLYSKYRQMDVSLSEKISNLQKRTRSVKKEKRSKDKEIVLLQSEARTEALQIMNYRDEINHSVIQILGSSKTLVSWSNLNIQECLFMPDPNSILEDGIHYFKRLLIEDRASLKKNKNLEQANFYAELLFVLKGHSTLHIEIPGMRKSVADLIGILQTSLDKLTPDKHRLEAVDKCIENLIGMEKSYKHFIAEFTPRINDILTHINADEEEFDNELYQHEDMVDDLQKKKEQHEKDILKYRDQCIKAGLHEEIILSNLALLENDDELQLYAANNEQSFIQHISKLESRYFEKDQRKNEKEAKLDRLTSEQQDILSKKPHRCQHRKQDITVLYGKIEALEQRLRKTCVDLLKALPDITDSTKLSPDHQNFYDQVALYLGTKVGSVRHVEGEYEIEKIDLIKGIIHTKSGKEINLLDMGTGQGQGAYLQGLLASNDDRKVIALIDEVAMMDSKTISPVINRLCEMYRKGKLICGIIVQRSEVLHADGLLREAGDAER